MVPHGSVRWATPIVEARSRSPQAVRCPFIAYQVAVLLGIVWTIFLRVRLPTTPFEKAVPGPSLTLAQYASLCAE